jgi:hypothetical protein
MQSFFICGCEKTLEAVEPYRGSRPDLPRTHGIARAAGTRIG